MIGLKTALDVRTNILLFVAVAMMTTLVIAGFISLFYLAKTFYSEIKKCF